MVVRCSIILNSQILSLLKENVALYCTFVHKWKLKDQRDRIYVSYHRLPKGSLRSVWQRNLRRQSPPSRGNTYVCSAHFTPDCFERNIELIPGFKKRKMLKPSEVPTIFPFPTACNEHKTRLSSVRQITNRTRKVM